MLHMICHQGNANEIQCDTTTHLLEWPKPSTLTTSNAGDDVEQEELSQLAGGNRKYIATLGDSMVVS